MKIVVTGAAGMLGRDVTRAAERAGHRVVALARADLDVTDAAAAGELLARERPDAVVNCAAWTDVDGAEEEIDAALAANAPYGLFAAVGELGAVLVQLSTDYVFDGTKGRPYLESDPPCPRSVYGRTKLAGEREAAVRCPRHLIVRSSWLYGTGGPNFVETMMRLGSERDEVRVVDDQVGCPTYTPHLAEGVLLLLEDAAPYGIHHLAGGGECSWWQFAGRILEQVGSRCRVLPQSTAELGRPAPRPAYSVLRSEHPGAPVLPDWREGLSAYLAERAAVPVATG